MKRGRPVWGKSHRQNSKCEGSEAGMRFAESHRKADGWSTGEERRVESKAQMWSVV